MCIWRNVCFYSIQGRIHGGTTCDAIISATNATYTARGYCAVCAWPVDCLQGGGVRDMVPPLEICAILVDLALSCIFVVCFDAVFIFAS